jgi:hypothetical protein
MARKVRRDLQKESLWRRRLAEQAASGLSIVGWCRQNGVAASLFHFWKRTIARREGGGARAQLQRCVRAKGAAGFAQVVVSAPPGGIQSGSCDGGAIEIVLRGGPVVRVSAGFDARTLVDVLAVLEGRGC